MSKNKIIAGVLAMSIMAASTASLTANAATIPGVVTNFEYDLKVEVVSTSQLKLTFYTIENPGVSSLALAFMYDPDEFIFTKREIGIENDNGITPGVGNNTALGLYYIGFTINTNLQGEIEDHKEDFSISIYLNAKDGNVVDGETYDFSCAVAEYQSKSEGIAVDFLDENDQYNPETNAPDIQLETVPVNYTYILGDADLSSDIGLSDVSMITSLLAVSNANGMTASVDAINNKIESRAKLSTAINGHTTWDSRFSSLLITRSGHTFACVEASDVDKDGLVEQSDADAVAQYYADNMALLDPEAFSDTPMYKVIYV